MLKREVVQAAYRSMHHLFIYVFIHAAFSRKTNSSNKKKQSLSLSLRPLSADTHPEAQEGASFDQPLRRTDRTRPGRQSSFLPRLQPPAPWHPGGE